MKGLRRTKRWLAMLLAFTLAFSNVAYVDVPAVVFAEEENPETLEGTSETPVTEETPSEEKAPGEAPEQTPEEPAPAETPAEPSEEKPEGEEQPVETPAEAPTDEELTEEPEEEIEAPAENPEETPEEEKPAEEEKKDDEDAKPATYKVTFSLSGANGTVKVSTPDSEEMTEISADGFEETVKEDSTVTFTVQADEGYSIDKVEVNGERKYADSQDGDVYTYTVSNIDSDKSKHFFEGAEKEDGEEEDENTEYTVEINHVLYTDNLGVFRTVEEVTLKDADFKDGSVDLMSHAYTTEGMEIRTTDVSVAKEDFDNNNYKSVEIKYGVASGYRAFLKSQANTASTFGMRRAALAKSTASVYVGQLDDVGFEKIVDITIVINFEREDGSFAKDTVKPTVSPADDTGLTYNFEYPFEGIQGYTPELDAASQGKYFLEKNGDENSNNYIVKSKKSLSKEDNNATILVIFKGEEVEYTVKTYVPAKGYKEVDLEDEETYQTPEAETKTGKVGEYTNETPVEKTGFRPAEVVQEQIKADGTTEVIVKYVRNTYKVTYDTQDGSYIAPVKGLYEEEVDVYSYTEGQPGFPEKSELICGQEAHTHTSRCETTVWDCNNNNPWHSHSKWRCEYHTEITCGKEEHTHVSECYKITPGQEEIKESYSKTPTKPGYIFTGWYYDQACTEKAEYTVELTGDVTVYAGWKAGTATYTVNYYKQVWNNTTNSAEDVFFDAKIMSAQVGTNVNVSAGSSPGTYYEYDSARSTQSLTVAANGSAVANVYYKLKQYTMVFKVNNNRDIQTTLTMNGVQYTNNKDYTINVVYGQDISGMWPTADQITPNTERNRFRGWKPNFGTTTYVTKRFEVTDDMLPDDTSKITYTGQWSGSLSTYTVEYYLQELDGTYTKSERYSQTYNTNQNSLNAKNIAGYTKRTITPNGYNSSDSNNKIYRFYYDRANFSISFYNGATEPEKTESNIMFGSDIKKYYYVPTRPSDVDDEYEFGGWYTNNQGQGIPYFVVNANGEVNDITMPAGPVVLYAIWNAPIKTVTVNYNNGTENGEIKLSKGGTLENIEVPVYPGHEFVGWFDEAGNEFDISEPIFADVTITARWSENTWSKYTVRHVVQGSGELIDESSTDGKVGVTVTLYALSASKIATLKDGKYKGYTVVGEKETQISVNSDEAQNIVTFEYAPVTDLEYKVVYKYNGEILESEGVQKVTTTDDRFTVYVNEQIAEELNEKGYIISDGTKNEDEKYNRITNKIVNVSRDLEAGKVNEVVFDVYLVAYTISYDLDGGTDPGNPKEYNRESTITLKDPTKEGYEFTGWTPGEGTKVDSKGSTSESETFTILPGSRGHLTFKANWNIKQYPYTVKYLEAETNKPLHEEKHVSESEETQFGKTVEVSAEALTGYTVDKQTKTLKIGVKDNEIIFYYTANSQSLKVKYVDDKGAELAGEYTASVAYDDAYDVKDKVPGSIDKDGHHYILESTDKDLSGVVKGDIEIKAIYTLDDDNDDVPDKHQAKVTFRVVKGSFDEGAVTEKTVTFDKADGEYTDSYTLQAGDIPGSTAEEGYGGGTWSTSDAEKGSLVGGKPGVVKGDVTYTITYTANSQSLKVKYVDDKGAELAGEYTASVAYDDAYDVKDKVPGSIDKDGHHYILESTDKDLSGVVKGDIEIKAIYTLDDDNDDVPDKHQAKVTFRVVKGSFDEGAVTEKTVTFDKADGEYTDSYTLQAGDIPGSTAEEGYGGGTWSTSDAEKGSLVGGKPGVVKGDVTYTITYTANSQSLKVKYVDDKGAELAGEYTASVAYDDAYDVKDKVPGSIDKDGHHYILESTDKDLSGVVKGDIEIKAIYTLDDDNDDVPDKHQAKVTFRVVKGSFDEGAVTEKTVTFDKADGEYTDSYTLQAGDIPGSTAEEGYGGGTWSTSDAEKGSLVGGKPGVVKGDVTYTITYTANSQSLKVKYVDDKGAELAGEYTASVAYDDAYDVKDKVPGSIDKDGHHYILESTDKDLSGVVKGDIEIKAIYTLDDDNDDVPDKHQAKVTFRVVKGSFDEGAVTEKTVTFDKADGEYTDSYTLQAGDIPGSTAEEGYGGGTWSTSDAEKGSLVGGKPGVVKGDVTYTITYTANSQSLKVKYVDDKGAELAGEYTASVAYDDAYNVKDKVPGSIDKDGHHYILESTDKDLSGVVKGDIEIKAIYTLDDDNDDVPDKHQAKVTFRVVKGSFDEGAVTEKTVTFDKADGEYTDSYTLQAGDIPGSTAEEGYGGGTWSTSDAEKGSLVGGKPGVVKGDVTYTITYTANSQSLKVKYVDDKGAELAGEYTASVAYDDAYDVKDKVPGSIDKDGHHYILESTDKDLSGVVKGDIEIKAIYTLDDDNDDVPDKHQAKVTFRVVKGSFDEGAVTEKTVTFDKADGEYTDSYTLQAGDIPGSTAEEGYGGGTWSTSDAEKGSLVGGKPGVVKGDVTYTITYTANSQSLKVKYVDDKGAELAGEYTASVAYDDAYDVKDKVPGSIDKDGHHYILESTDKDLSGVVKGDIEIKAIYTLDDDNDDVPDKHQAKVTFRVVKGSFDEGAVTEKTVTFDKADGEYTDSYTLQAGDIPGSTAEEGYGGGTWSTSDAEKGSLVGGKPGVVKGDVTYTITYTANSQSLKVKYVDDKGAELAGEYTASVAYDDAYDVKDKVPGSIDKDGHHYILESTDKDLSGVVKGDIEIKAIYTLDDIGGGEDGNEPDGTPDKYQATVIYKIVNGTWGDNGGNADQKHVLTLAEKNEAGEWDAVDYDRQIPADMKANAGYGNGSWDADPADAEIEGNGTYTFTYTYVAGDHKVTVQYVDDNNNALQEDAITNVKYDDRYDVSKDVEKYGDKIEKDGNTYIWEKNDGEVSGTVKGDVEVTVYYTLDNVGGGEDGNEPDGTPDKYQATVIYKIVNGTWGDNGNADQKYVLTLAEKNEAGEWKAVDYDRQIPADMKANAGYGNGSWDADPATATIEGNGTYTFTYTYVAGDHKVTVKYVDEDGNALQADDVTDVKYDEAYDVSDKVGKDGDKIVKDGNTYIWEENNGETTGTVTGDVEVTVQYTLDNIGENGNEPDGIPDKYQVEVTFKVVNGTWTDLAREVNTGDITKVVTLRDANGNPSKPGEAKLSEAQIPGSQRISSKYQKTGKWDSNPRTAVITGAMTFTITYSPVPNVPTTDPTPDPTPTPDPGPGPDPDPTPDPTPAPTPDPAPVTPPAPAVVPTPAPAGPAAPAGAAAPAAPVVAVQDDEVPLANIDLGEEDGEEPVGVEELVGIEEEEVPLANEDIHDCCIFHFLEMLLAIIILAWYTHNSKKRQKRIFELREQLAVEQVNRGITPQNYSAR